MDEKTINEYRMRYEPTFTDEISERLRGCETLLIDIDGTLFPGPDTINELLEQISRRKKIIPCTTRSWGEMTEEDYPGNATLISTSNGIYEAGLVVKQENELILLCDENDLVRLNTLKQIFNTAINYVGARDPNNKYSLFNDTSNPKAFGYLQSLLGQDYLKERAVPIKMPSYPDQFSMVVWPSGSASECPSERNFYQTIYFLDGLKAGRPDLFENMDILIGEESIVVRPLGKNGKPITKLTGVEYLQASGEIDPAKTLFIADDDALDSPVGECIRQEGGLVIVPQNAGQKMKELSNYVVAMGNIAGYSTRSILTLLVNSQI